MKYLIAASAVVVALGVAAFAEAGQQAVTPGQFAALSKRVAKLEKDDKALVGYVGSCFSDWAPFSRYGGLPTEGYAYVYSNNTAGLESALDITSEGDKAHFYTPASDADCTLSAYRKLAATVDGLPKPQIIRPSARGSSR